MKNKTKTSAQFEEKIKKLKELHKKGLREAIKKELIDGYDSDRIGELFAEAVDDAGFELNLAGRGGELVYFTDKYALDAIYFFLELNGLPPPPRFLVTKFLCELDSQYWPLLYLAASPLIKPKEFERLVRYLVRQKQGIMKLVKEFNDPNYPNYPPEK